MATYGEGHDAPEYVQPEAPEGQPAGEPSSHETAGQFPADDVGATRVDEGDGPSSHETAGPDPAGDVAASTPTEPEPEPAPEPTPEPTPAE